MKSSACMSVGRHVLAVAAVLVCLNASAQTPTRLIPIEQVDTLQQQVDRRSANVNTVLHAMNGQLQALPRATQQANELALNLHQLDDAALAQATEIADLEELYAFVTQSLRQVDRRKGAGSAKGMEFFPLTPCRIADSRSSWGPLQANEERPYYAYAALGQGGSSECASSIVPQGQEAALALTVTTTQSEQVGFLTVSPKMGALGTSSALNFVPGMDIANSTVVKLSGGQGSQYDFFISSSQKTAVIVDVLGYYAYSEPKALECVTVPGEAVEVLGNMDWKGSVFAPAPACSTGYTQTAVYCSTENNYAALRSVSPQGCSFVGVGAVEDSAKASTQCCQVPSSR